MATHSSILAWKFPWTEWAWQAKVHGVAKSWLQLNDGSHMLTPLTFQTPVRYCSSQHWAFTARRIHSWASFLLWPSCLILSGAIGNCPPLFPSSVLDTFWPGGLAFWCHIFLPFQTVHEHIHIIYIKQVINKELLCSIGTSAQRSMVTCVGEESEKEKTDVCVCVCVYIYNESLCCTPDTNTTL